MYNGKCPLCDVVVCIQETDDEILKQSDQVKELLEHHKRCDGHFSHLDIDEAFAGLEEISYHD